VRLPRSDLRCLAVSIPLGGDKRPASEVQLFHAGWNDTQYGSFLLDEKALASVMAAYEQHAVPLMIDLEHLSLHDEHPHYDPRARGRASLVARDGGTPDGEARIVNGDEIYVSPAFFFDADRRITRIHNVGLVANPATDGAMPLAASARMKGSPMDFAQLKNCLAACKLVASGKTHDEAMVALAIDIKTIQAVVKEIGGDPSADLGTLFAAIRSFAQELADMEAGKPAKKSEDKPAEEPKASDAAPAPEAAALRAGVAKLDAQNAEIAKLSAKLAELESERSARVAADYREATGRVVKHGGLTPARAWADEAGTKPRPFLLSMSIDELRAWGDELAASSGRLAAPKPPAGADSLSDDEKRICAETKCDPQTFAALKALRNAARH
jgi:phage I-like protein